MLQVSTTTAILKLDTVGELSRFLDGLVVLQEAPRRWHAVTNDGVLMVPPDEYFLDAMIARCDLTPEVPARPFQGRCGVAAVIEVMPLCDVCHDAVARYDASLVEANGWGFMCEGCYPSNSNRLLGTGVGQYLFTTDELTGPIADVAKHITAVCWPDE